MLDHVHVHVAGAVRTPGLYRVVEGSRVADVVDAAGGPLLDGDLDRVNLAALVVDGERIEVPRQGESTTATIATGSSGSALVDLNRGSQADLVALPGIGPSLAAAIIEHRERLGAFRTVDELEQVPGIGPAKLSALRDLVRV